MSALTLVSAWGAARKALEAAGLESPIQEARALVEAAADVRRLDIVTDPQRAVSPQAAARLEAMIAQRLARTPLAYILGRQGFWTLDLAVTPDVLIPRADSEALVHAALRYLGDGPARVLDLGTGSGALLLAILAERPGAQGVGVDASPAALAVAQENAARTGLESRTRFHPLDWRTPGWIAAVGGPYDLVVANPPYIETGVIATLAPEVAEAEPRLALDGGPDGLDAYRILAPALLQLLRPGGGYAFETGRGQAATVANMAAGAGLIVDGLFKDLGGVDRVVHGVRRADSAVS